MGEKKKESNLEEKLVYKLDFAWSSFSEAQRVEAIEFARDYIAFLDSARIERERVAFSAGLARERDYKELELGVAGEPLQPGDRVYYINRNKNIALFVIGKRPMIELVHVIAAHLDSPRVDLKIRPLYEDTKTGVALLKTHYYGGLKKYQFATTPLFLLGVVIKRDGTKVIVDIGRNPSDPVFTIPDLLVHLNKTIQSKRVAADVMKGEEMNALAGATEIEDDDVKEKFKLRVLKLLDEKYGIVEDDLHSAELSLVPGLPARHVGFDKSMVGSPGQDDGICSYAGLRSILDVTGTPAFTACVALFDKEEIGSNGNTGAQSAWMGQVLNDLLVKCGVRESLSHLNLCLKNIKMLSADVTAAMDPTFPGVHDPKTAAIFGKGIVLMKYTGHGGKYATSDATAEYISYVRNIFGEIPHQIGTLGAVDAGGGGTIAKFFAEAFNCDVIDAGPALLNMHSPFEVSHVADLYSSYLAFKAFILSES
ncbi:MAG: aminopeptidase [Promethearchaeota archaeon]